MLLKETAVVMMATLCAIGAGGGVLALGSRPPAKADIRALPAGEGRVAKAADGHFWADADVDGAPVRFLVDTGASVVMLTEGDAERLGVDLKELRYTRAVATAAGDQRGADVMLDHVSIAGARVDHVEAMVIRRGLPSSLLGMSYLGRLSRFTATPAALVLDR